MKLLRRRHAFGVPVGILDQLLLMVLATAMLTSCAPVLNPVTGDSAVLAFATQDSVGGFTFDPGDGPVAKAFVDVIATTLTGYDETICVPTDVGVACTVEDITETVFIHVSGTEVSATVAYRRPGSNRVYHEGAVKE